MPGLSGARSAADAGPGDTEQAQTPGHDGPPDAGRLAGLRREAITWYVRLSSGEATEADRQAWADWYATDEAHREAWRPFETLRSTLGRLPTEVAADTLRNARRRRRVLRDLGLLAAGGGAAWMAWSAGDGGGVRTWLADHRTAPGEQRTLSLADGSRLILNTRTAIDVRFDAGHRRIHLLEGELLAITAPGSDPRPFVVRTSHGEVRALGTRFTVRTEATSTLVAVLEHAVEIRASDSPGTSLTLAAGHQARFTREGIGVAESADALLTDWTTGSLVVHDRSLGEVLGELTRYRRGHLGWDPAIAQLRISGAFPLAEPDKALAVIARSLPVRITTLTRYWVKVVPA